MQMQTQQRMLLSNRETRNETNLCVLKIHLKLNKEIELSCKSLGREFHAAGAEKTKLRFPNLSVRTRCERSKGGTQGFYRDRLYVWGEVFGGLGMYTADCEKAIYNTTARQI